MELAFEILDSKKNTQKYSEMDMHSYFKHIEVSNVTNRFNFYEQPWHW